MRVARVDDVEALRTAAERRSGEVVRAASAATVRVPSTDRSVATIRPSQHTVVGTITVSRTTSQQQSVL